MRMLLEVVSELPDNELLLQKHFTALISSVWRVTSRSNHIQYISPSRNGICMKPNIFNSSNHLSQNRTREPKLKSTNFSQCSKLVAAALNDVNSKFQDTELPVSNPLEETSNTPEEMEITLEFQDQMDNAIGLFPSVIRLSVFGSELSPSVNNPSEDKNLKSFNDVAERRFR